MRKWEKYRKGTEGWLDNQNCPWNWGFPGNCCCCCWGSSWGPGVDNWRWNWLMSWPVETCLWRPISAGADSCRCIDANSWFENCLWRELNVSWLPEKRNVVYFNVVFLDPYLIILLKVSKNNNMTKPFRPKRSNK